nr:hypothetical protein [Bacillus mobilis]
MGTAAILTLSACSDEKPQPVINVDEVKEKVSKKESKETSGDKTGFNVIEQQKKFGGGTFNVDKSQSSIDAIDVTEIKDGIVLATESGDFYKYVFSDKKKWKNPVTFDDSSYTSDEIKGNRFFVRKEQKLSVKEYSVGDPTGNTITKDGIPFDEHKSRIDLIKTSKGAGALVSDSRTNKYEFYLNDKRVAEFTDEKGLLPEYLGLRDNPLESNKYVDLENKKLYVAYQRTDRSYIYQFDMKTGKPLFAKNGDLKEILIGPNMKILGDNNGNIYVMEESETVTVTAYDKNLNPLTKKFEVPVKNPALTTFTVTNDELHFWSSYEYELEPMLELTRVSIPSFGKK